MGRRKAIKSRPVITMAEDVTALVPYKGRGGRRGNPGPSITLNGANFLKDSFAPPDFQHLDVQGVPDMYEGRTMARQHVLSIPLAWPNVPFVASENGFLLLVTPTPGIAAWIGGIPTAGAPPGPGFVFHPILWTDSVQMFPIDSTATNVTEFRYMSLAAELVNTDPALTVQGSVSVLKIRLNTTIDKDGLVFVTGDESIPAVISRAEYSGKWSQGVYSVGCNSQADWEFQPLMRRLITGEGTTDINGTGGFDFASDVAACDPQHSINPKFPLNGFGNMETIAILVKGLPASSASVPQTTSFTLRLWATVEYKIAESSILYPSATNSPAHDPMALALYRQMATVIPVAVPVRENANFWTTLLGLIGRGASFLGGVVPGPWGALGTAVGAGASWLANRYA